MADSYHVAQILECYFQSLSLDDNRAHCTWSGDGFEAPKGTVLPCKQIRGWTQNEFTEHQNTIGLMIPVKERIKDLAIRKNCDWCPSFSIKNFRES